LSKKTQTDLRLFIPITITTQPITLQTTKSKEFPKSQHTHQNMVIPRTM